MAIKIKSQNDYLLTEVTTEMPTDLVELEELLKHIRATGKVVVLYSSGGKYAVNIEQRHRIPRAIAEKVRKEAGIGTTEV